MLSPDNLVYAGHDVDDGIFSSNEEGVEVDNHVIEGDDAPFNDTDQSGDAAEFIRNRKDTNNKEPAFTADEISKINGSIAEITTIGTDSTMKSPIILGYIRISTPGQMNSYFNQRYIIEQYLQSINIYNFWLYSYIGGAYYDDGLQQLLSLTRAIAHSEATVLVAVHGDRLSRSIYHWAGFIEFHRELLVTIVMDENIRNLTVDHILVWLCILIAHGAGIMMAQAQHAGYAGRHAAAHAAVLPAAAGGGAAGAAGGGH